MELRQLEYFRAVVEAGSFLGASEDLATAQPTVWRQVKVLERELGVPLFERSGRRVKPTSAGRVLLPLAEQILGGADRLTLLASELKHGRAGIVTIECAHPHLETFLAPLIGAFHADRAEVKVEIRGLPGFPQLSRVIDGACDFITSLPANDERLTGLELGTARIVVVTTDRHPWRNRTTIDVDELAGTSVLLGQSSSLTRRLLEPVLQARNMDLDIAYQSVDVSSLIALGRAGLGVAIVAEDRLGTDTAASQWPSLCDGGSPMGTSIWLYWSAQRMLSPSVVAFAKHVAGSLGAQRDRVEPASDPAAGGAGAAPGRA
ncbi:LysR family transcriptional regulator [Nocardia takedensis]